MNWIVYAVAAAVALGAADIMVKLASGKLPTSLGLLIYGSVPFLMGVVWFTFERMRGVAMPIQAAGVGYAFGVGAGFALVTICLYAAFNAGAPISIASPIIRVGGLVVAAAVGILLWREGLSIRYLAGIVLSLAGIFLMLKN